MSKSLSVRRRRIELCKCHEGRLHYSIILDDVEGGVRFPAAFSKEEMRSHIEYGVKKGWLTRRDRRRLMLDTEKLPLPEKSAPSFALIVVPGDLWVNEYPELPLIDQAWQQFNYIQA